MTDESTEATATEPKADPEWYAEAMSLHEQGIDADSIAKAVGKTLTTVRRLIRRKADEAEGGAAAEPDPPADDAAAAQAALDADPARVDAETAARLAASAGDSGGDPDHVEPQLFPLGSIDGDGYSLKQVGKSGEPITDVTVAMSGGEVPMPKGSGLLDPHREGMLLVTYECQDGGLPIPIREGDRGEKKIVGWKTRQRIRPVFIERVKGEEGVIEGHFAALLEADPTRAGALLDRLIVRAGRSLK